MSEVEQENQQLKEEVASLKAMIEQMNTQMAQIMAAQNRPPTPPPHGVVLWPVSTAPASTQPFTVAEIRPLDVAMTLGKMHRLYASKASAVTTALVSQPCLTFPQITATANYTTPLNNVFPYQEHKAIYHAYSVSDYDQVEDLRERFEGKFEEVQKEMRALRGKDFFGQEAH